MDQLELFEPKKILLELYSGTQSIGKWFRLDGWEVLSVELNTIFLTEPWNLNQWTKDILELMPKDVIKKLCGRKPDVIWASPLCTTFSQAGIFAHRDSVDGFGNTKFEQKEMKTTIARSEKAILHDKLLMKTLYIINELKPKLYFIENPRASMRKSLLMRGCMFRHTVTYCQYGHKYMKPTDLWTNHPKPEFKKPCKNGDTCHESAPRGSSQGTQGLKGNLERSIIPPELCKHILKISNSYIEYMKGY